VPKVADKIDNLTFATIPPPQRDDVRTFHLTTAYGGASPQGEAFERFASKPYTSQLRCISNASYIPCSEKISVLRGASF
jgi:hypothetical protein